MRGYAGRRGGHYSGWMLSPESCPCFVPSCCWRHFGFTGVALGAFAAHGLKKQLSAEYLAVFQTGVHYQLIHALALFGVALLATRLDGRLVRRGGWPVHAGHPAVLHSLYLLTLSGIGKLGIVTPFGGVSFLAGWLCTGPGRLAPGQRLRPDCLRRRTCRQGALVIGVDRARMPLLSLA